MARTRILFPFAGDTILGGSHVSAMALIKALDRNRFDPCILIHFEPGFVGDHANSLGLEFEVIPDVPLLGTTSYPRPNDVGLLRYAAKTFPALVGLIKRHKPDIIHTNEGRIHTNWTLPIWFSKRKHLWHHRQDPNAFGVNKLAPVFADYIASVSEFSMPKAPVLSIDNKFRVVRSPFDFPAERPEKSAERRKICSELNLPDNAVLLGYFGMLTNRKRPVHFIDAVFQVQKHVPDRPVHGLLFGDVETEDQKLDLDCKSRAADLGIAGNIHFMGFRKPISGYMAGVDATLVTALNEPFGRTLIEAMYLGTPVIATRHGGNPEAIVDNETGFLVDHESPGAFTEPVLKLLHDPELYERISSAAQKNAQSNYGRSQHVNAISEIYDQLVPPNR